MADYVTKEDLSTFGQDIAKGIAQGMREVQRPKVTLGEFAARNRRAVKLRAAEVFQNGARVLENVLSDKEIRLLNEIHRSGRYLDRKVEVIHDDTDPQHVIVQIRVSDKTRDQRNDLARLYSTFEDMLAKVLVEQSAADEEAAAMDEMREEARRKVASKRAAKVSA